MPLLIGTPFVGYVLHQIFRLFFEMNGGYARKSREAISYIQNLAKTVGFSNLTRNDAFVVWDISIFDNSAYNGFREHNARAWHYAIGFWASLSVSIIGTLVTLIYHVFQKDSLAGFFSIGLFCLSLIFYRSGKNVYKSINDHEMAFIHKHKKVIQKSIKGIHQNIN